MKNFIVSFLEGDKIIQLLNKNYQIARELLNNRGIILPLYHVLYNTLYIFLKGFPDGSEDKVSACDAGDLGLIPGSGSPGEGNGTHSSTLAWRIPWTEEPCGLQSMGSQRVGHDRATSLSLSL